MTLPLTFRLTGSILASLWLSLMLSLILSTAAPAALKPQAQAPAQPGGEPAGPASIGQPQQPQQPQAQPQPQPQPIQQNQNNAAAAALQPHMIVSGIPGVQQCPAPDWIKPGMRLAFFSASATVAGARGSSVVPDSNGNIVDSTGKRYRSTSGGAADVGSGSGGAGYSIIDVVASEPGVLILECRMYLLVNGTQGLASLISSWGEAIHPSGCDWFLHPALLKQMKLIDPTANSGVSIMRSTEQFNGQNFNALRITTEASGRTSYVYDLSSGVMLSYAGSATSTGGQVFTGTHIVQGGGNTYVMNRFISAREMNLPWVNSQMPPWVRTMKRARYTGANITKSPPNLGVADFRIGLTVDLETTYVGNTFSVYKLTSTQQQVSDFPANAPGVSVAVCGPGSVGGVWMDPNALRQLQTGQILDRDQTLGSQTVVEFTGQGQNGKAMVAIATTSAAGKITNVYDAGDGKLLSMTRADAPLETGFSTSIELQLAGME